MAHNTPPSDEGKLFAILSYASVFVGLPIWVFPLFIQRNDPFSLYHAKQAGATWLVGLGLVVVSSMITFITCGLGAPLAILPLLALIPVAQGALAAVNGECKPTLVDGLAQALFGSLELEGAGAGGSVHAFLRHSWVEDRLKRSGPPANAESVFTEVLESLSDHLETPAHLVLDGEPISACFFDARNLDQDERNYYFETMICESEGLPFEVGQVMPIAILDMGVYNADYAVGFYEARYVLLAHLSESSGGQTPIYIISSHSGFSGSSYKKLAEDVAKLDIRPGPGEV